ncbi:MAG TPA: isoprenylcysteine carboxylmethyltransferase family protein [Anaerolineales bacterium]
MTISFCLILLAMLAYRLLHTILASLKIKAKARRWFGSKFDQWLRLFYNFIAVITLLLILVLPVLLIDKELYRIPYPWVIATLTFQAVAVLVVIIELRQTGIASFIGLCQLFLLDVTTPPRLVTGGLYRYVRHPQYFAGLVFICLLPIMTCNLLALYLNMAVYILIGAYFEERKLMGEYGEAYSEYRRHTPMLIPGLHLSHR